MINLLHRCIGWLLHLGYPLLKKVLPFQVYCYLACGAMNTALNIGLFALFYQAVLPRRGCHVGHLILPSYTIALILAFVMTIPSGFWLNRHFAFRDDAESSKRKTRGQRLRYLFVVGQGLLSDYFIMTGLIVFGACPPTPAKMISTVVVLTINYVLQKKFTFRQTVQSNAAIK